MTVLTSRLCRCTMILLASFFLLHCSRTAEGFVVIPKTAAPLRNQPHTGNSAQAPPSHSCLRASFLNDVDPVVLEKVLNDVATGGVLAFAGDIIAQSLTSSDDNDDKSGISIPPKDWDTVRTAALTTFGALYTGGAQHFVFGFINSRFDEPIYRLLTAQFFFIPFCYYPTFLLMVPTLRALPFATADGPSVQGNNSNGFVVERERLTQEVLGRLPATLLRNWCFWLPVQFVQFSYIPTDMQVTYCAAFGVIWNAILSWSTMQTPDDDDDDEQ